MYAIIPLCSAQPDSLTILDDTGNHSRYFSTDITQGQELFKSGITGNEYPIQPVPFTSVQLADSFWLPRINKIHDITIPHILNMCEDRIMSFKIAAGLEEGSFQTTLPFDDTDVYKIIEAAGYSLYYNPDTLLESEIDSIISIIALAQEPDGYLYTSRTIGSFPDGFPVNWLGSGRWDKVQELSHELYNLGHLFEAGCAWYQATGKNTLLNVAVKAADLVDETFGWGKLEKYPGHQIVEVGLARLYRVTGDRRYLDLAKFFLDVRGPGGAEYSQAHLKVIDQEEAVGHSVRAVYMYSGMADVAALTNDYSYVTAIDKIWEDIVTGKTYVTGGIGSSSSNEGFTVDYDLPNSTSYCENCSSIGNIYYNHRLFQIHGESKYIDVLERILYNALLSGISLSGDRFFYYNRLQADASVNRSSWFGCACCPPNLAKLIPSVPGYIYATSKDTLYVNLFISDTADIILDGANVRIIQETGYPWNGNVHIEVSPAVSREYTLMVRIPGWAQNEVVPGDLYQFKDVSGLSATIKLNGEDLSYDMHKGYAVIKRTWSSGDDLILNLPMEPRKLVASEQITVDRNKFTVQRGPLVFCAEGVDNPHNIFSYMYDQDTELTSQFEAALFDGIQVVRLPWKQIDGSPGDTATLIPYSYWNNRGGSPMEVWLSDYKERLFPDSLNLILMDDFASTNYVSPWETLNSIYDLFDPSNSADKGPGAFGNWQAGGSLGKWNWVQYNFKNEKTISSSEVYWWRDGAGINIPEFCYLSYRDEATGTFKMIESTLKGGSEIKPDQYNKEFFLPVTTKKIRLNFYSDSYAQGILEWKVYSSYAGTGFNDIRDPGISVRIWPNPALNSVSIGLDTPDEAEILVYSLIGELVYRNNFSSNIIINRSEIGSAGIYIAIIKFNGRISRGRLVFQ